MCEIDKAVQFGDVDKVKQLYDHGFGWSLKRFCKVIFYNCNK